MNMLCSILYGTYKWMSVAVKHFLPLWRDTHESLTGGSTVVGTSGPVPGSPNSIIHFEPSPAVFACWDIWSLACSRKIISILARLYFRCHILARASEIDDPSIHPAPWAQILTDDATYQSDSSNIEINGKDIVKNFALQPISTDDDDKDKDDSDDNAPFMEAPIIVLAFGIIIIIVKFGRKKKQ